MAPLVIFGNRRARTALGPPSFLLHKKMVLRNLSVPVVLFPVAGKLVLTLDLQRARKVDEVLGAIRANRNDEAVNLIAGVGSTDVQTQLSALNEFGRSEPRADAGRRSG